MNKSSTWNHTTDNYPRWLHLLFVFAVILCCQAALAAGPYTYNALGNEVTDTSTGLVWQRCSAGQTWSAGSCSDTATAMTHEAALTHATGQTGWRLPNVKELTSLVDSSRINPALDIIAFPNSSNRSYWTSSPVGGGASGVWYVNFNDGSVSYHYRTNNYYVRLVR